MLDASKLTQKYHDLSDEEQREIGVLSADEAAFRATVLTDLRHREKFCVSTVRELKDNDTKLFIRVDRLDRFKAWVYGGLAVIGSLGGIGTIILGIAWLARKLA